MSAAGTGTEAVRAKHTAALWPHDGDDGVGEPAPGDARGRHEPLGPLGRELALAVDQLHRHPLRRVALLHLGRSRAVVGRARLGLGLVGEMGWMGCDDGGPGPVDRGRASLVRPLGFRGAPCARGRGESPPSWFYTSAHPRLLTAVCAHASANSFPLLPLDKNFELRGLEPADSVTYPR